MFDRWFNIIFVAAFAIVILGNVVYWGAYAWVAVTYGPRALEAGTTVLENIAKDTAR